MEPFLTPIQALEAVRKDGPGAFKDRNGFTYAYSDTSGGIDTTAAIAVSPDGEPWYTTGEPGDQVTEQDTWVQP